MWLGGRIGAASLMSSTHSLPFSLATKNVRFYAEERKKYERSLPHVNVGTIGHVDHGKRLSKRIVENSFFLTKFCFVTIR